MKLFKRSKKKNDDNELLHSVYGRQFRVQGRQITKEEFKILLDLAIKALNLSNELHDEQGINRIALKDLAQKLGNGITKEQIVASFFLLQEMEVIGDDGDYDYMNYDEEIESLKEQLETINEKIVDVEK